MGRGTVWHTTSTMVNENEGNSRSSSDSVGNDGFPFNDLDLDGNNGNDGNQELLDLVDGKKEDQKNVDGELDPTEMDSNTQDLYILSKMYPDFDAGGIAAIMVVNDGDIKASILDILGFGGTMTNVSTLVSEAMEVFKEMKEQLQHAKSVEKKSTNEKVVEYNPIEWKDFVEEVKEMDPEGRRVLGAPQRKATYGYGIRNSKAKKKKKDKVKKIEMKYLKSESNQIDESKPADVNPEKTSGGTRILDLNFDELYLISEYLDFNSFVKLNETCKSLHQATNENYYWKDIIPEKKKHYFQSYIRRKYATEKSPFLQKKLTWDFMSQDSVPYKKEYSFWRSHAYLGSLKSKARDTILMSDTARYYRYSERVTTFEFIGFILFWICLCISSVLGPLTYDDYIPRDSYWWLFAYSPALIFVPYQLLLFYFHCKLRRFFPFPTKKQLEGNSENIGTLCLESNLLWISVLLITIGVKLAAFPSYSIWQFVFIPTYLVLLYFSVMSLILLHVSGSYTKTEKRSLHLINLCWVSIIIGIHFIAAKMDSASYMSAIPWSVAFIPVYISLLAFVHVFTVSSFIMFLADSNLFSSLCFAFAAYVLLLLFLLPIFVTMLIVGLKLDGIISAPMIALFSPLYGVTCTVVLCVSCIVGFFVVKDCF